MLKVRENIIFITGLFLVLLIWVGTPASSPGESRMIFEATEMHTSDCSSGYLSIHDDACEDEQLNQFNLDNSLAELVLYFPDNHNSNLIFQPCLIPWEPPRI
jgi:hypothetical protein